MEHEQPLTKKQRRDQRKQEFVAGQKKESQQATARRAGIWTLAIIALVFIGYGVTQLGGKQSSRTPVPAVNEITSVDQIKGNKEASVTLVEYSDFQCPACRSYYPVVEQLVEAMGDEVRFVYRHFPLRSIHANAEPAAIAAEAAGKQGKFWEMHDLIFDNQTAWADERNVEELFVGYAAELGLDVEQFSADLEDAAIEDKVQSDALSGTRAGVSGTPTFFLNGNRITPAPNYEAFRQLITEVLPAA